VGVKKCSARFARRICPPPTFKTVAPPLRDIGIARLYFATRLAFNDPPQGFPWDDLRKSLHGGQTMTKVQNGKEL